MTEPSDAATAARMEALRHESNLVLAEVSQGQQMAATNLLEKAFEKPPNQYSTKALEFFLVEKCIRQGCSRSTAEGIQAAFADYWDHM